MKEYQLRVVEEKCQLDVKRKALDEFLKAECLRDIPLASKEERERMMRQLDVMTSYSNILAARISHF